MFSSARVKKIKAASKTFGARARRYGIIASVLLNLIGAGGVIGWVYLEGSGYIKEAQLPGAGLNLHKIAFLSEAIPSSQLHQMPVQVADAGRLPDMSRKPAHKPPVR